MKRFAALFLIFCLLLSGCGGSGDELTVEVQREAAIAAEETVTVPTTEAAAIPTEPPTEAPTEPSTEPPTEAPTEAPTEPPTEAPTEPPTEAPTEPPTEEPTEAPTEPPEEEIASDAQDYVLNKNSKKFHYPHCGSVKQMKDKNRKDFFGSREEVISMGYDPCKNCHP